MTTEEVTLETHELTDFLRVVEDWRNRWVVGEGAVLLSPNCLGIPTPSRDDDTDGSLHGDAAR